MSESIQSEGQALRIVVTGGSGFIGSAVVREALNRGFAVSSLIRASEPVAELPGLTCHMVDWEDLAGLAGLLATLSPDMIVHGAGCSARGSESLSSIYDANVAVVWTLLEAVATASPASSVVLLSSAAVYGPAPEVPADEVAATVPHTHYAASKILAEEVGRTFSGLEGTRVVIARPFNVLGVGEPEGSVVGRIAEQLATVPADGVARVHLREASSIRDFVDVRDVARALLYLGEHGEAGEVYNVCSGLGTSVRDLAQLAAAACGCSLELTVDLENTDPSVSIGCPDRISALGWTPEMPLGESLRRIVHAARQASIIDCTGEHSRGEVGR